MQKVTIGGEANRMCVLYNGECITVMKQLIEAGVTVNAIICDPPYG